MKKFQELKDLVSTIENDAVKFYEKGNKAAGTRLRNGLQQIKGLATDIRKDVTEIKNKAK
ncbi:histone H1-like protein Hc1 [Mucilaginibacter gracilis]|uniref:Histone H1-like protein Hc1 n=1 Tax=Mucilaginibacter gracilis TaxID=423350 RepID=A0A495J5M3_9SPHI|nr:histone H1 [Mucilaginibacter gracilis]RKR84275.1 histone H1-like protein Hc1 [Mucilaginibacter gracilis]